MSSNPKELIRDFYTAFQQRDVHKMLSCYHKEVIFQDPVFGPLDYEGVRKMWTYLLEKGDRNLEIRFEIIDDNKALWDAQYLFSKTNRKVHNKIKATFEFKEGQIVKHDDDFDAGHEWHLDCLGTC